jgi:hypothetical protein
LGDEAIKTEMKMVNLKTEDSFEKARKAFFAVVPPVQKASTSTAESAAQPRNEQAQETSLAR